MKGRARPRFRFGAPREIFSHPAVGLGSDLQVIKELTFLFAVSDPEFSQ